jgi:hypothetical protein
MKVNRKTMVRINEKFDEIVRDGFSPPERLEVAAMAIVSAARAASDEESNAIAVRAIAHLIAFVDAD